jgi:hypothetical protein
MDLLDLADDTALDTFDSAAQTVFRGALVAHLCGDLVLGCGFADFARFVHGMHERFLHISMETALNGHHGGRSVVMIRSGDYDCIEILFLLEHNAIIFVVAGIGEFFPQTLGLAIICIAQSDDILAHDPFGIAITLTATAITPILSFWCRRRA